jgi:hypothetical protein
MEQTAQRVDRLVRSLVGVDDLRPSWDAGGQLRALHVLRNACISDQQLARNVASGLQAALGMKVQTAVIRIYSEPAVFTTSIAALEPAPTANVPVPAPAVPPAQETAAEANGGSLPPGPNGLNGAQPANGTTKNGHPAAGAVKNGSVAASTPTNGTPAAKPARPSANSWPAQPGPAKGTSSPNPVGNGSSRAAGAPGHGGAASKPAALGAGGNGGASSKPAAPAAASAHAPPAHGSDTSTLRLERLAMDRQGVMLRCRVVLALDEHRYSAIAEAPAGGAAEVELAARVTLDALRAGALTCAHLEGVGFSKISELTYVVAAIRGSGSDTPRAAAAPLIESAARAAAEAVLNVVGPITAVQRTAAERRLGKL